LKQQLLCGLGMSCDAIMAAVEPLEYLVLSKVVKQYKSHRFIHVRNVKEEEDHLGGSGSFTHCPIPGEK
jgi:hypothetical protein